MNVRIFIFLFLILGTCKSFAEVTFYNINTIYGISIREPRSICEDENGFIWVSFEAGIMRLTDGDHRIYQLPYKKTNIAYIKIACFNSHLYAYTHNGQLFQYDDVMDCFNLIADFQFTINTVYVDKSNVFWLGTSSALYRYEHSRNILQPIDTERTPVNTIVPYKDDSLLFGTSYGVRIVDANSLQSEFLYKESENQEILSLYYDAVTNGLWVGSNSNGLYYYDIKDSALQRDCIKKFPKQPIRCIEKKPDSHLLVGIDGRGIWELTAKGDTVLNVYKEDMDRPSSLRGNGIYDILCDRGGKIWVATFTGGLSYFNPDSRFFTHIAHQPNVDNSLINNTVNRIMEDSYGHIWIATNNGINRWNRSINKWESFFQNKQEGSSVFLALCEDNDGNIWAGSYSSGIYVLNAKTGKEIKKNGGMISKPPFVNKFIFDIFKDSKGDIWIAGANSDVLCYSSKENRLKSYPVQNISCIVEYNANKLLMANWEGVVLLDTEKGEIQTLLENFIVRDLLVIDKDIWMATSREGLVRYNYETKQIDKYPVTSELLSNNVNSITHISDAMIVATDKGLYKFMLNNCEFLAFPPSLFPLHGLYSTKARTCFRDQTIALGSNNGMIVFDPDNCPETYLAGKIFFQDVNVSGRSIREYPDLIKKKPVNELTGLSLDYSQNTLSIELIPIGVTPSEYKLSWKLEGIDSEWSKPSELHVVNYTNIPNGNYRLSIKMLDNSFSRVLDERSLDIQIIPPFWYTIWFIALVLLVITTVLLLSLRFYIKHLEQLHAQDKMSFFTNVIHDLRTSLTLLSAPIEELNKEMGKLSEKGRYYLNLATEQSGRLSSVATQLLDFQKVDIGKGQLFFVMTNIVELVYHRTLMFEAAAEKKGGIKLHFSSNIDAFNTAIDQLKIEKVVDNLISNAIKYSHPESQIDILLHVNGESWSLEVKDYGLGISKKAQKKLFKEFYRGDNTVNSKIVGSGIGLLLVKNYVTMHNGKIQAISKEDEGTSFKITIPYREVHIDKLVTDDANERSREASDIFTDISLSEKENSGKKPLILVVEDNNDLCNFLKCSLEEQSVVKTAANGEEAWQLIREKSPDLVVSDVMMPIMDGFELCKLIKSTFETSHIPVILLTSLTEKTKQLQGLDMGADDYIAKPFDMGILIQRIKTILKNRLIVRERVLKLIIQTDKKSQLLSNDLDDKFVKKAIEVIHKNVSNTEFGVDEFASMMHVSSSLLYNKLKTFTGKSPIELIKTIRLNHAMELLQSKKYSVTEVSELSGFSSISYFSTVFKKYFGKSPTDFS
ncbi:hybrid sensor histidine kinase/response regulator transcription factor [Bacteroides sp. 51]|uniref:hybrid sensor histidine kinase/response regulator transcription factor n=1 Tax=Bacteroides sp. 51 TaxID=2302938 RepID=UPI0013D4CC5B|nr:hybrid sensor histidine kinase/response regulator transcription factor [Bacteroides sp. 51]NDV81598.1 hybrid sensor histidine kinase/response regulator [Bacteroides sp. 51]